MGKRTRTSRFERMHNLTTRTLVVSGDCQLAPVIASWIRRNFQRL